MSSDVEALGRASERAAAFLRAVAHPGRLRIVCALLEGERSASELAQRAGLRPPALSQQAVILEAEGLIARRRAAQSVHYRLIGHEAPALAQLLYRLFCHPATTGPLRRGTQRGTSR